MSNLFSSNLNSDGYFVQQTGFVTYSTPTRIYLIRYIYVTLHRILRKDTFTIRTKFMSNLRQNAYCIGRF
jgi:hypothetical protein